MALTKVSGDFIQDGSITQGHLHASHGITTSDIGEGSNLYFTTARVDSRISDLSTSDLSEGTNLYYTQARFNTAFAAKSTSDLSEGTNLYYTDARADARIAAASTSDLSEGTNLYYTDARVGSYLTTNSYATQSYVNTQVSNLVDSAPSTLDTLNELAAALGDDANFSTTVTNSIATKMPLAGGTFTGDVTFNGRINLGSTANSDFLTGDAKMSVDGYVMAKAIVNTSETGSGPAAIVFGDNSTYGNDQISFVTTGINRMYIDNNSVDISVNATFASKILNTYTGTGYHELQNGTSNGTVLRLLSTGDSRTLTLQTDHIYSNGTLYFGDNSYVTNFRGSSYNFSTGDATFAGHIYIPVAKSLFFGGSSHTYISEDVNDRLRFFTGGQEFMRFTEGSADTATFYTTVRFETTPNVAGSTIWHAGNDGSGSGLDADLLDGQHASAFASASHDHDDRYYTESEMQTFFNRGYINSHDAGNLPVGWYTIATNTGDRALGEFQIWETAGGRHQSVLFSASHHFGVGNSNDITVLANSKYSTDVFRYIRIKEAGTYDGAALQVYIDNATNGVHVAISGANAQVSGWVLKDWVADATDPGDVSNYSSFSEQCRIDLDNISGGGIATTGNIFSGGATTQYRNLTTADEGSGNGLDADTLDGVQGSNYLRSNTSDTFNGTLTMAGTLALGNNNITGVNHIVINDAGVNEGIQWTGGNNWYIQECPDAMTNASGNLQFSTGTTRRFTINTSGYVYAERYYDISSTGYYLDPGSTSNLNAATFAGDITVNGNQVITQGANADVKFSVWSGTTYGIGMTSGVTLGHLNDYAMTFCMNNDTDRGFWWGYSGQSKSAGAMALTTNGMLTVTNRVVAPNYYVDGYIYHNGDTNTYIRMIGGDDMQLVAGGRQMIRMDEGGDPDKLRFVTDSDWTNSNGNWAMSGYITVQGAVYSNDGIIYDKDDSSAFYRATGTSQPHGDIFFQSTNSIWFNSQSTSSNYLRLHGGTSSGAYFDFNSTGSTKKMHWRQYGTHTRFTWDYSTAAFLAMGSITANGSDERLKENIVTIDDALNKVKQMRGVYFNRTDIEPDKKRIGFIAQEVRPILPEVVEEAGLIDGYSEFDDNQILTISYANITALIVEAVKEQQTIIDDLKSRIETLENQ